MRRTALFLASLMALVVALGAPRLGAAAVDGWTPVREVEGVAVESRTTNSAFNEHRGETLVCASIEALENFVADTSRFTEWLPYTKSARLLDSSDHEFVYYVRSTTPWPLKDRDMVYRITRYDESDAGVRLRVLGLPDYQPEEHNVTRIREAAGQWRLREEGVGVSVSYQLYVDAGRVPAFVANRRLAAVVGKTLANLAAQFPCVPI